MRPDLHTTRKHLSEGLTTLPDEMELAITIAQSKPCEHAFVQFHSAAARAAIGSLGLRQLPFAGLPISVKDLFDEAGCVTTAGSRALRNAPPAVSDSPAVARLKAAGAVVLGRTNMTEFAFSGIGVNPHYGTPANPCDPHVARIPGGSSSGAAVSVATGAAFMALGSDTGGSIRIPAALCGIVGFKNTARLVPTEGTLPLSTTLDTVCAMSRSVRDAILAHEILSGGCVSRSEAPLSNYRLAVAQAQMLDGLEPAVARAFDRTLGTIRRAGAEVKEIPLQCIRDLGSIQARGGFAAAESYAWHRHLLEQRGTEYDPRVRARIELGSDMRAYEYIELHRARRAWISTLETQLDGFDAVLSPTVPMVAPLVEQVCPGAERDAEFFRINALLLRNPSVVNMLDGCAISLPCQAPDELPVGLMIWQGALRDNTVLNIAQQVEHLLASAFRT